MADVSATEVINNRSKKYSGDQRIPFLLNLAEEFTGDRIPAVTSREYAKALLVLHWLTLDDRVNDSDGNCGTGTISEEKEGELSVKYSPTAHNVMYFTSDLKGFLAQTVWGLELYSFMKRFFVPVVTRFS